MKEILWFEIFRPELNTAMARHRATLTLGCKGFAKNPITGGDSSELFGQA